MHLNKGTAFSDWLGIRVYIPERTETEVVWHLIRNPAPQFKNIMTIGIFGEHAFLIKDITKLAKTYECNHCHARFTQSNNLQRHAERCAQGKTVNRLSRRKGRSATDSLRESLLSETQSLQRINSVAGVRGKTLENPHCPRNVGTRRRTLDREKAS